MTERIPISEIEARVSPTPPAAPPPDSQDPAWLGGFALVRKALQDPSERSAVRAWAREQVFYLRSFPIRAHQTDAVSRLILESAERLEQPEPLTEQEVASATVVVAYLKMRSRGFREPFALAAEIARLERARSGRLHADLPAFRMELEDFRVLMELDPDPANRAAMAGVFLGLGDDPLMLNPVSRIFYLLCQKRAEEGAVQAYLTAARRLRRLEEEKSFGNNDVRTVEELRRLPEIRKECGEKRAAAVRILSLRSLDLAGLWSSL